MLNYIKGQVKIITSKFIILEINNLGYKIFLKEKDLKKLKKDETVEFYTHQYVREDTLALYGFFSFLELEMFEILLSISGVGPKSALGILNLATPSELREAVAKKDPGLLTKVSGIGSKIAERIILELKNKWEIKGEPSFDFSSADEEVIDVLVSLGYNLHQARTALKQLPTQIQDTSDKIKAALKIISKK